MKKLITLLFIFAFFESFAQRNVVNQNTGTGFSGALFTQTANAKDSNTVNVTSLISTGYGPLGSTPTLPPNFLLPGRTIRITVAGTYKLAAVAPGTLTIYVMIGGVTAGSVVVNNFILSAPTGFGYKLVANIICRTSGTTGSVMLDGQLAYDNNTVLLSPRVTGSLNSLGAVTTVNTTISNLIGVTAKWGTASSSNVITSTVCTIETLN